MSRSPHTAADLLDVLAESLAPRIADRVAALLRESRPKPAQEPRYLGERAVAERLGISVRTLQSWRSVGRGPEFQKAGRRVLYPVDRLQRFLDGGTSPADGALPAGSKKADREPSRMAVRTARQES
jgi:hypothetical protein